MTDREAVRSTLRPALKSDPNFSLLALDQILNNGRRSDACP
jgi:hypothetical protein